MNPVVLKPSLLNGLIPIAIRKVPKAFIITVVIGVLALFFRLIKVLPFTYSLIFFLLIIIFLILTFIPLAIDFFTLLFTKYIFFKDHVIFEFKFLVVKRRSVPYSQIVGIQTNISIWDRICNAGDIVLYTAEDKAPEIVLYYIRNPLHVEKHLYSVMGKRGLGQQQRQAQKLPPKQAIHGQKRTSIQPKHQMPGKA